jgi:hypothetical protein
MVKEAEGEYSRQRLRSLADEWIADYPDLLSLVDVLKGRPAHFSVEEISNEQCLNLAIRLLAGSGDRTDELNEVLHEVEADPTRIAAFRNWLVGVFNRVGLIGLKLEAFETASLRLRIGNKIGTGPGGVALVLISIRRGT